MTELELYKFCEEKELDWRGKNNEELIIWIYIWDIDDFVELVGEDFFVEGGYNVNLQYKQIAFDLVPICECFGIDPEHIYKKEDD